MEASAAVAVATRPCAQCGTVVPLDIGFTPWCERCDWNVVREAEKPGHRRLFDRFYAALGRRSATTLWRQLATASNDGRRLTISSLLGGIVAAVVHAVTLLFLLTALYLLAAGAALIPASVGHPLLILGGLVLLLVTWIFRPRTPRLPDGVLPRAQFPALYAVADRVAEQLGMRPLDGIFVEHDYNASFYRYGWRRRRMLGLGLPLWLVLEPQERVALIGHELGHDRSGDATRGRFVGGAIETLQSWHDILRPRRLAEGEWGLAAILGLPLQLALLALAYIPLWGSYLLALLFYRDKQRAEYRADLFGATISGTAAALAMLEKLHFGHVYFNIASGLYVNPAKDVFGDLRNAIGQLPPRELERVRRESAKSRRSLDASHPPTVDRVSLLQARRVETAKVVLTASESERIDRELEKVAPDVRRALVEEVHRWMDPDVEYRFEGLGIGWDW